MAGICPPEFSCPPEFTETGIQLLVISGKSTVILVQEVSGKHLSFMEHPGHDNGIRIVDIESNQMAGLSHRRAC